MVNLSLVIPCYNEEKNIDPLFEKLKKLSDLDNRIEIIIVDNGSTDKTNTNILKNELYKKDKIKLLLIEKNVGYGTSFHINMLLNLGASKLHRKSFLSKIIH